MKKNKLVWLLIALMLMLSVQGCGEEPIPGEFTATPTPDELAPAVEFFVEIQAAEATAKAIEATQVWIYGQLTATQESRMATATERAYVQLGTATAQAFFAEQRATQQAFEVTVQAGHAKATAEARATEQQAALNAQATATAFPQTATAQSIHATQTQQAANATATMGVVFGKAQATAVSGDAERVHLAVQREQATNTVIAWFPWFASMTVLAVLTYALVKVLRVRVLAKDAFGAAPVLVMDGKILDPDRMPGPAMITSRAGVQLVAGDMEITRNAQKIQAIRAMPPGKHEELPMLDIFRPAESPITVQYIPAGQVGRAVLDDITQQVIDEEE